MTVTSPWLTQEARYDAMLDGFGAVTIDAVLRSAPRSVLDVGCGTGAFTLELARRLRPHGHAVGIDIDPDLVDRARERAWDTSAANARFIVGDAAAHDYGPDRFDAVTSRFGAMLFPDPVPAFRHLADSLVPGGALTFVCWREPSANVWFSLPVTVAARHLGTSPLERGTGTPGPFAFADADHVQRLLSTAGFPDVAFTGIDRPVCVGNDPEEAVAFYAATLGAALPPDVAAAAEDDLRQSLEPFTTVDGVLVPASAWLVTARRGPIRSVSRQFNHTRGGSADVKANC
jgi:SAM-dependent methyltransferase